MTQLCPCSCRSNTPCRHCKFFTGRLSINIIINGKSPSRGICDDCKHNYDTIPARQPHEVPITCCFIDKWEASE